VSEKILCESTDLEMVTDGWVGLWVTKAGNKLIR
jgi:hypothetical protein